MFGIVMSLQYLWIKEITMSVQYFEDLPVSVHLFRANNTEWGYVMFWQKYWRLYVLQSVTFIDTQSNTPLFSFYNTFTELGQGAPKVCILSYFQEPWEEDKFRNQYPRLNQYQEVSGIYSIRLDKSSAFPFRYREAWFCTSALHRAHHGREQTWFDSI